MSKLILPSLLFAFLFVGCKNHSVTQISSIVAKNISNTCKKVKEVSVFKSILQPEDNRNELNDEQIRSFLPLYTWDTKMVTW